jgi:hypothetical protein
MTLSTPAPGHPEVGPVLSAIILDWRQAIAAEDIEAGSACLERCRAHYDSPSVHSAATDFPPDLVEVVLAFDMMIRRGPVIDDPDAVIAEMIEDCDRGDWKAARAKMKALQGSWASGGPQPTDKATFVKAFVRKWES